MPNRFATKHWWSTCRFRFLANRLEQMRLTILHPILIQMLWKDTLCSFTFVHVLPSLPFWSRFKETLTQLFRLLQASLLPMSLDTFVGPSGPSGPVIPTRLQVDARHPSARAPWTPGTWCGAVAGATAVLTGSRRRASKTKAQRGASFGPTPISEEQKQDVQSSQIGSRVSYVVLSNMQAILRQLDQYGYSQVDGFLGGSANGYPDQIRDEMKSLFDKGWFEEEPESEAQFKVGPYRSLAEQKQEQQWNCCLWYVF